MSLLRRRPAASSLLAIALVVPVACSGAADRGAVGRDVDPDERVETVLELRSAVGPSAVALGSASATLVEAIDELHAHPPPDLSARGAAVAAIRSGPLAALEDTLQEVGPELATDASGPDAARVRAVLTDARSAASELVEAAERELALLEVAIDAEERLADVVAAWSEPGSRNEQLQRLDEVAAAAGALATELDRVEDVPGCAGRVERRAAAARAAAAATRELRALVEQRRGEEFDARRGELVNDPYGTRTRLVDGDRADLRCWREEGPVVAAGTDLARTLADLEAALNPADLASPAPPSTEG